MTTYVPASDATRLLATSELFCGLHPDELAQLAHYTQPFRLEPGEDLFTRGQRTDHAFVIASGALSVITRGPDGPIVVGTVGPGELVGEMALLTGEPRSATLRAVEPTTVVGIPRDVIESLRRSHRPGSLLVSRHLAELACRRIRRRLSEFAAEHTDGGGPCTKDALEACEPDDIGHVASLPWFAALGDCLPAILPAGRWLCVPRGSVLACPGAEPESLYVPARGAIEELLDAGDRRYRVRLAGPGRAAGNLGIVDDGPSPTTARTLERAIVFELPKDAFARLLDGGSREASALLTAVTQDLARAVAEANAPHPWELRA